jgi:WD40 repeat protein
MALSPDGNLIAVSYDRGKVINSQLVGGDQYLIGLLDTRDGREKNVLSGHTKLIGALAFSADGKLLASAGSDKTARMWNVETGQQIRTIELPRGASALTFLPSGKFLAVGLGVPMSGQEEDAPNFLLSEVHTGKIVRRFSPSGSRYVTDVASSSDGNLLAIASEVKPDITIWDTKSWANVQTINDHTFNVGEIAFSSKERLFVSSDSLGQIFVRVAGIDAKPRSYKLHVEVKTISLSSDGTKLAAGTAEGKIILMQL